MRVGISIEMLQFDRSEQHTIHVFIDDDEAYEKVIDKGQFKWTVWFAEISVCEAGCTFLCKYCR